jgi:hypothetical protein
MRASNGGWGGEQHWHVTYMAMTSLFMRISFFSAERDRISVDTMSGADHSAQNVNSDRDSTNGIVMGYSVMRKSGSSQPYCRTHREGTSDAMYSIMSRVPDPKPSPAPPPFKCQNGRWSIWMRYICATSTPHSYTCESAHTHQKETE